MCYPRELFSIDEARTARNLAEYDNFHDRVWNCYYARYDGKERSKHDIKTRHEIIKAIEKELKNQ